MAEPEFSRARLLSRAGYSQLQSDRSSGSQQTSEDSRTVTPAPSYWSDRRYRLLRTLAPSPYRSSPFYASAVSLPDIKEAVNEENENSSNSSVEHDKNALRLGRVYRASSQQDLELAEGSNSGNLVAAVRQSSSKNVSNSQSEASRFSDRGGSSGVQWNNYSRRFCQEIQKTA
ncbi:unnamed protein product [Gongylonema pulchrum]|uniref:SUN1 n=1 Tax=Gongylonema pulchrum TaxID=637853 RepID=A0A183CYQ1_9BILA|nr:unnamed protein product [Gongylonema pulchrum]